MVKQSHFLNDAAASGNYHNFSAQALVLRQMVANEEVVAHWGSCDETSVIQSRGLELWGGGKSHLHTGKGLRRTHLRRKQDHLLKILT